MAIIAVICGADTWDKIEEYCEAKEEWLAGFLNLENGIPSHNTFNRVNQKGFKLYLSSV
ncbi:MAG: transposase family protein [Daejeonella sp.]